MRRLVWSAPLLMSLLGLSLMVAGCPKRPGTALTSAPAPFGAGNSATGTALVPAATTSTSNRPSVTPHPSEFSETSNLRDIHFDFDRYDIRPADTKILDADAIWLNSQPADLLLIEGHCDERGTNEYNLALGERRARAVMNYLVAQGLQARRITLISYGKERPACTDHREECWALNRRAHFLVKPQ